jgi:NAD(P)-dependent dehydrogenase (short-subunit alcohol dehydrogenase family)
METKPVVLITGASTGFGRLIAETLARSGGYVVYASMRDIAGKNSANAIELRALADRESLPIRTVELDVTSDASVQKAIDTVVAQAGRLDVVINNAGYALVGLTETITTEQAQKIMDTNFMGCIRVNRAVLPQMRRQHSGLLLHVSSGAGRIVFPSFALYCASKFAMEAFAESYRYELASLGIDSVILEPGAYRTPVFSNIIPGADASRADGYGIAGQIPTKIRGYLDNAAGDAQEVADATLRILQTPAGQRELRYRVNPQGSATTAVDQLNSLSQQIQTGILQGLQLVEETTFTQRKPASAS